MSDEPGAAAAAAEPSAATSIDLGQGAAPPPADRASEPARASVDRAFAALEKGEADAGAGKPTVTVTDTTAAPGEKPRDGRGRFVGKDGQPQAPAEPGKPAATAEPKPAPAAAVEGEPPSRWSEAAKAAWKSAPPEIRTEVTRTVKELETGLGQYQQAFEPLKPFFAMAQKAKTTVHEAMGRYVTVEQALRSTDQSAKLTAIEGVLETAGITPQQYAAIIAGQPVPAVPQESEIIKALRGEIDGLKRQVGGIATTHQEQQLKEIERQVETFAKDHPRLNDNAFADKVSRLITTGMAANLQEAYEMAERLIPAPVVQPQPDPAHTQAKGNLSVTGAPASGSNPATRKAPATARESLDRSFASLGLG